MKPLEDMGKYATVVIDPPWPLKMGFAGNSNGLNEHLPYYDMTEGDIAALPVGYCLAADSLLFAWCTNRTVATALAFLEAWGTSYWFMMTWVKNGGIQLQNSPMFNAEWCVVGRKGKPKFNTTKAFMTANVWTRGGHSEKPEEFYDLLRRVAPAPRLDIFNRRHIPGFDSWGDQAPEPMESDMPVYFQEVLL